MEPSLKKYIGMNKDTFINLQKFVVEKSFVDDEPITTETRLYEDLGIYGDDAVEFLIAFGKEFNVDVSKFMAADYFKDEGAGVFNLGVTKKALTVGHLEKAIMAGRLDEEVINS
jgi:acyl carrier protein